MSNISVVIGSSIKLNPRDLPKNILDEIFNKLTVPNPQKKIAEREMLWNAKYVPSHIKLWKYNSHNELILPRGFEKDLFILLNNNVEFLIYDYRVRSHFYNLDVKQIDLRVYQDKAVQDLICNEQGIYKAPTGSGKSRVMLEVIRQAKQRTLVICEKIDILQQWYRYGYWLGFDTGLASGRHFDDNKDIVVAMRQTIWAKKDELRQDWFKRWGMVVLDECHHASAETMFELLQRFPARYRFGCSATPDSDPDLFPIARAVIGPVVAETDIEEIGDHLVIPSVKVVKTEFEFPYRPTVRAGNKVIRNNYNDMMACIEKDYKRNKEIVSLAIQNANEGRKCLVLSNRISHIKFLYEQAIREWRGPNQILVLTGENSKDSLYISEQIDKTNIPTILFSTLAKEGTDIPCLDRLFLAYPGRKVRGFEQAIGRIMRPHPQKKDAIVYDFRDYKVPILNSQYRYRAQNIYNKKEYKVETL